MKKAIAEIETAKKTIADQAKRISELDKEAQEYHDRKEDFATALSAANKRIAELEGSAKADESRLIAAAEKARITYFGCDTPDHLADRILELESFLIEERACGLFNGPWCSDLPDDCGYDAEMNAARIEAHQQLRSEGKI
jgi:cell division septum initiation protein DivIVA